MSDALAVAPEPANISHQRRSAVGKSAPKRVTGKLRTAVDAMALEGLTYQQAAQKAGLTTRAVRLAFDRPHVKAYYQKQIQVFLTSERARNFHRAVDIRDNSENHNAALNAAKWLTDPLGKDQAARADGRTVSPGVVVTVNVQRGPAEVDQTVIEVGNAAAPDSQSGD